MLLTQKFFFVKGEHRFDQIIQRRKEISRQEVYKLSSSSKFFIRINFHTPKPIKAQLGGLKSGVGTKDQAQLKKIHGDTLHLNLCLQPPNTYVFNLSPQPVSSH